MKTQPSEPDIIKAHQRAWATRNELAFDADGYCGCVDDNIVRGLSPCARKDFESGDGTELGKDGSRGKIQALHSSSALACNWFDYWRDRDLQPLSRAFGVPLFSKRLRAHARRGIPLASRRDWRSLKNATCKTDVILCRWRDLRFVLVEVERGVELRLARKDESICVGPGRGTTDSPRACIVMDLQTLWVLVLRLTLAGIGRARAC